MQKIISPSFLPVLAYFALIALQGDSLTGTQSRLSLWYDEPAEHFTESLVLGNGRQGAMVFGKIDTERIVLNEISMWSGAPQDADRKEAQKYLPEIQDLLLQGKNIEAQQLLFQHFTCSGPGSGQGAGANVPYGCYQTLGDLILKWQDSTVPESLSPGLPDNYRRELDIHNAIATVSYTQGGTSFSREIFVTAPDQAVVVRMTCDKPGQLTFTAHLTRPERFETGGQGSDTLLMHGQLNNGVDGKGVKYASHLRAVNEGGTVSAEGNVLKISNANAVTLYVTAATDNTWPDSTPGPDPIAVSREFLNNVSAKDYPQIRRAHVADFRKYFDRVSLTLDDRSPQKVAVSSAPTDERLKAFQVGSADSDLMALYFQFGRYLLISSSRPGGMPANLQGLWAEEIQTPWNGDYHLNINVQMNYWPAEITNLAEIHLPLLKLVESLRQPGRKTARAYYNADGWVAHVITNVWGFTSPGEGAGWGSTVTGSAWLCQHLWHHYEFNPDTQYLAWAYPILKGSAEFYLDMLIEEPVNKWLATAPSNSPENSYILPNGERGNTCMGPTMDSQIVRELFGNCIKASEILGLDEDFRSELKAKIVRLAPNQIGKHGQLQEWLADYDEAEPHHRHIAHLYALHPGQEITLDGTPELAQAAKKTLQRRGDAGTGWSLAWKSNFWARLGDGNRAYRILKDLLRLTRASGFNYSGGGSGTFPNLFCAHPPFQIDGNFGATSGIAEMLLQSHAHAIHLLPALPDAWPTGSVKGLCARGGFVVNIAWQDGHLTQATIHSKHGRACRVRYGDRSVELKTQAGKNYLLNRSLQKIQ